MSLPVVILAVCCTFSTVASEHPCAHEEGSAHRQPLCSSDRPGAWHQVSFPHIGDQPHPLLQLPSWGHAGERRAVSALWTLWGPLGMLCDPAQVTTAEGWRMIWADRHVICVTHLKWYIETRTAKKVTALKLSAVIVGLSPFLFTRVE